jgi:tetratricopeptide (TPR) repeat protein
MGQWDVMERAASKAVAVAPDSRHFCRLANVLASRPNADYEGAAKNYEAALKIDADNGSAWYELAQVKRNLNDIDGAIAAADKAAAIMKSPEARLLAVRARLDKEDVDPQTLELAKAVLAEAKVDTLRAQAQSLVGAALLKAGDVDGALDAFAKADVLLKDNAEHHFWYGVALLKKTDADAAKARMKTVVDIYKNGTVQNAVLARLSQKAVEVIEKLEPGYHGNLPEPGKTAAITPQPKNDTTAKAPDKPMIRKILPPVIEDDGPAPIPTELPRPK